VAQEFYKERFDNLRRVSRKVTSSLDPGDILETLRDETKLTVPHAREACLLLFDPEAKNYTRPLHCSLRRENINCQLCKKGRDIVEKVLKDPSTFQCTLHEGERKAGQKASSTGSVCEEIALPISDGEKPLAVLDVVSLDGRSFDEKDITLLKDLADLATNAILNARAHWKLTQERLTLDSILKHIRPFVPETVHKIVEKNPFAPSFEKREADVSILFLDVAGYTRISEKLSREQVNFIIEKYFSAFLDEINHHHGDINETAGDGLMAIFQGDEKENSLNACQAALHIRDRAGQINGELEGRFAPVAVNMGINSGRASLGMNRFRGDTGTRMTFTASGAVTNLAARLAAEAKGGDILIGEDTKALIEGLWPTHDRGLRILKGIEEPVRVYSLLKPG
jgi:class 3 adenylate cyclase